jgi:hypothetical protein
VVLPDSRDDGGGTRLRSCALVHGARMPRGLSIPLCPYDLRRRVLRPVARLPSSRPMTRVNQVFLPRRHLRVGAMASWSDRASVFDAIGSSYQTWPSASSLNDLSLVGARRRSSRRGDGRTWRHGVVRGGRRGADGGPHRPTRGHDGVGPKNTAHRFAEHHRRHGALPRGYGSRSVRLPDSGSWRARARGHRRCCDPQCTAGTLAHERTAPSEVAQRAGWRVLGEQMALRRDTARLHSVADVLGLVSSSSSARRPPRGAALPQRGAAAPPSGPRSGSCTRSSRPTWAVLRP